MTGSRVRPRVLVGLFLALLAIALQGVQGEEELGVGQVPSEVQCRPYIEKALKDLGTGSLEENSLEEVDKGTDEDEASPLNEQSAEPTEADNDDDNDNDNDNDNDDDDDDHDNDNDDEKDNDDDDDNVDEVESAADHSVQERSAEDSAEDRNSGEEGADNEGENSGENDELAADEPADDDGDTASGEDADGDNDTAETVEVTSAEAAASTQSDEADGADDDANDDEQQDGAQATEEAGDDGADETGEEQDDEAAALGSTEEIDENDAGEESTEDMDNETGEEGGEGTEETKEEESQEDDKNEADSGEDDAEDQVASVEENEDDNKSEEDQDSSARDDENHSSIVADEIDSGADETQEDNDTASLESGEKQDDGDTDDDGNDAKDDDGDDDDDGKDDSDVKEDADDSGEVREDDKDSKEESVEGEEATKESAEEVEGAAASVESQEDDNKSEESAEAKSRDRREVGEEEVEEEVVEVDDEKASKEGDVDEDQEKKDSNEEPVEPEENSEESNEEEEAEPTPEEDLIQEIEVPENLRPREHINQLLKLDEENEEKEQAIQKAADIVLRDLKRLYDTAIKPLETLYKYRDLSNRHFGDPEIFSKPLVLFMGPWSGGKSSIVNYLLDNEYKTTSLRTGAEPSPAYFNILMHGEEEEILDGTQLAADWTFSGLQKFGQGMLDRLRGIRLNNKLLEKVNIVEIPGILEIRKQVQRLFPFNDACQWFIDRADIIFLVYDPAKLDVGPETEAILDQLKGREYQTRIILNKADQVKPEELMRVQGALIWNISPLMSSAEPPVMYSTSLWSLPYEAGAPTRLLYAQERAFLRDLRSAVDKRVEHKIASARRFAVRVRNHAKMVDCYLTTYYNHKSFFGSKKDISDKIIENPQDYHIYEGLSTLTNISRYDLPDPDVYKDFFRLNPLYDFQQLSSTCTYFRGCPINRLDVAIAYDLPELVGKYKKSVEAALHEGETSPPPS